MVASVTAEAVELPAGLFIDGELIRPGTAGEYWIAPAGNT
jgi:hypothetical protein